MSVRARRQPRHNNAELLDIAEDHACICCMRPAPSTVLKTRTTGDFRPEDIGYLTKPVRLTRHSYPRG